MNSFGASHQGARVPALATFVAASFVFSRCLCAAEPDVLVVSDSQHPIVAAPGTRLILLDQPRRLKSELASDLPPDPQRAASLIRQRLKSGGADLQRRFQRAYQDVTTAWRLGVTHIPAVVVDHRYVVYGESNVEAAIARINTFRSSHP